MLKSTYTRLEPKILRNRSYKDFYEECFLQDLQHGLSNNGNYSDFNNEFKEILNHHAPIKQTKVRGNTKPHINKAPTLLPLISKLYEKVLYQQIEDFANNFLSPKLCGFRKGHSTQHALLNLLKNWQKCLEKAGVVGTVLMDLS